MNSNLTIIKTLLVAACFTAAASASEKKSAKQPVPKSGVTTPGVQIPLANLKSEADISLDSPPAGIAFTDTVLVANATGIHVIDGKTNKPVEQLPPVKLDKACAGIVNAFNFVWTSACGTQMLVKVEVKAGGRPAGGGRGARPQPPPDAKPEPPAAKPKPEEAAAKEPERPRTPPAPPSAKIASEIPAASPTAPNALAASDDSVWLLADGKTVLQRIDPKENAIVGETRLPSACSSILFAETALWVTCPGEPKLLRVDPRTGLVEKRIEVPAEPYALTAGEASIWVLTRKEGKVVRVDPKTNKVTATIELGVPGAAGGLAFGDGSVWVSLPGFPVNRISPAAEKERLVQQFAGEGGGAISFGLGSVWVSSPMANSIIRYDPKRIAATFAE